MKNKKLLKLMAILFGIVFLYNIVFIKEDTVLTDEFLNIAKEQKIDTIYQVENTNGHIAYNFIYTEGLYTYSIDSATMPIEDKQVEDYIIKNNIEYSYRGIISPLSLIDLLSVFAPLIIFFIVIRTLGDKMGGDKIPFMNSKIEKTNVSFDDVIGHQEAIDEFKKISEFFARSEQMNKMGVKSPKGILLEGPPGVGKTLLAKAMATESNAAFFSITNADFDSKFVGEGPKKIKQIFTEARKHSPAYIFFDEFDSIGTRDDKNVHQEERKKINEFLAQMDGLDKSNASVIIIAATNNANHIDPAIKRSGRLDRVIKLSNPTSEDRYNLVKYYMKKYKFIEVLTDAFTKQGKPEIEINQWFEAVAKKLAVSTLGMSHADIDNVVNTIVKEMILKEDAILNDDFFQDAVDVVLMGPSKISNKYSEDDKRLVAFHEMGHAYVGHKLPKGSKVNYITIVPRGDAGGYTSFQEDENASKFTDIEELKNSLAVSLAGNVAEEIFMNKNTLGASNDYEKVTKLATRMVTEFGMSSLGLIPREVHSSELQVKIDNEIIKMIEDARKQAKDILTKDKELVIAATEYLINKESITYNEMLNVINEKENEDL